ncbi:unnamed protein product [Hymenolepis diminuta]|uniref:Uncharacterized protein n=1 Tax=Hymenolepis diminuta TaxID=6216 RepID=A0A564YWF7_HYMDI|nr:unnamed protein product [Hymenolepis diminuta]
MTVLLVFVYDSYKAIFVFPSNDNARLSVNVSYASHSSPLFLSTLPFLSLSISVTRINTRCSCHDYIIGLINSWCSAPRLLLALTQTTTNWCCCYLLAANR